MRQNSLANELIGSIARAETVVGAEALVELKKSIALAQQHKQSLGRASRLRKCVKTKS
jgi:hypothetical protein